MLKRFAASNIGILLLGIMPVLPLYVQLILKMRSMPSEIIDTLLQQENIIAGLGIYGISIAILFIRKLILDKFRTLYADIIIIDKYHNERVTNLVTSLQTHLQGNRDEHDKIIKGVDDLSKQITENMKNHVYDKYAKLKSEVGEDKRIEILDKKIEADFDKLRGQYNQVMERINNLSH